MARELDYEVLLKFAPLHLIITLCTDACGYTDHTEAHICVKLMCDPVSMTHLSPVGDTYLKFAHLHLCWSFCSDANLQGMCHIDGHAPQQSGRGEFDSRP